MRWRWARTDRSSAAAVHDERRDIAAEFRMAWTQDPDRNTANPTLLPVRLTRACASVLSVSAAGLSLMDGEFRVPLGASDELATSAERLQFTQGEGPCLEATSTGRIQASDEGELERRWPAFARELFAQTPYRAIICLPLPLEPEVNAALDLYLRDPRAMGSVTVADILTIGRQITDALLVARAVTGDATGRGEGDPAWMHGAATEDRLNVWVAMGMLMTRASLTAPDALALLRGYSYSHDTVVDLVAAQLMQGALNIDEVVA
jgi:hypothetical protein